MHVRSARLAFTALSTVPQKMQKCISWSLGFLQAGQLVLVLVLRDM
jgi:hypothetical protein